MAVTFLTDIDKTELLEKSNQLSKEIDDVIENDLLREVECPATWSVGNWDLNTGTAGTNQKRIRTAKNTTIADLEYVIKSESGVLFYPVFYDAENNFVPLVNNPHIDVCNIAKYAPVGAVKFRLVARTEPETTLTALVDVIAAKVHFYKYNTVKQYQGSSNVGKVLTVNENGFVEPKDPNTVTENNWNLNSSKLWEVGLFRASNGGEYIVSDYPNAYIRLSNYVPDDVVLISSAPGTTLRLHAWNEDGSYAGSYFRTDISTPEKFKNDGTYAPIKGRPINMDYFRQKYPTYRFKLVVYKSDGTIDISTEFANSVYFYSREAFKKIKEKRPAILTFIDDDGVSAAYGYWEQVRKLCGVFPSMCLVTSQILEDDAPTQNSYMTWGQVADANNVGYGIMSHTNGHTDGDFTSEDDYLNDLKTSIKKLHDHGVSSQALVYPGGWRHENEHDVDGIVKKCFKFAVKGSDGLINYPPIDQYKIKRARFLTGDKTKEIVKDGVTHYVYAPKDNETLKRYIDEAISNNGWLIFSTHLRNSYIDGYYVDDELLNQISDICKYAAEHGMKIMNVYEAYEYYKNTYSAGTLSDTDYYIVDADGRISDSAFTGI